METQLLTVPHLSLWTDRNAASKDPLEDANFNLAIMGLLSSATIVVLAASRLQAESILVCADDSAGFVCGGGTLLVRFSDLLRSLLLSLAVEGFLGRCTGVSKPEAHMKAL